MVTQGSVSKKEEQPAGAALPVAPAAEKKVPKSLAEMVEKGEFRVRPEGAPEEAGDAAEDQGEESLAEEEPFARQRMREICQQFYDARNARFKLRKPASYEKSRRKNYETSLADLQKKEAEAVDALKKLAATEFNGKDLQAIIRDDPEVTVANVRAAIGPGPAEDQLRIETRINPRRVSD